MAKIASTANRQVVPHQIRKAYLMVIDLCIVPMQASIWVCLTPGVYSNAMHGLVYKKLNTIPTAAASGVSGAIASPQQQLKSYGHENPHPSPQHWPSGKFDDSSNTHSRAAAGCMPQHRTAARCPRLFAAAAAAAASYTPDLPHEGRQAYCEQHLRMLFGC
jgi:hypothetical protein